MTKLMEQLVSEAGRLSPEAQDSLAAVWLSEVRGGLVSDSLREELERRLAEHEANPGDVVSWDALQARVRERLAR